MAKKALCVGINDYPYDDADLNGCVNDATAWADLLVDRYGFGREDVKLLLDADATYANIKAGLAGLVAGAAAGDVLVFTNSSHGTYVADTDGDEERYDEALCPYDCDDKLLVDDELRNLFTTVPDGVHLTVISDSCFSGSVTRVGVRPGGRPTPDARRVRFLNPRRRREKELKNPFTATAKRKQKFPESGMKDVLLSGCQDNEYSYDAMIGDTYHGAMSFFALYAIQEAGYEITYEQLHKRLSELIGQAKFPQHPQLEGRVENKRRQIFSSDKPCC